MAKFRSWNEEENQFYYWQDGEYNFCGGYTEMNHRNRFNWQNAEQIIEPIEADENALGCGLEDLNIIDRYDAMMYGFNQALELIENELNIHYEGK